MALANTAKRKENKTRQKFHSHLARGHYIPHFNDVITPLIYLIIFLYTQVPLWNWNFKLSNCIYCNLCQNQGPSSVPHCKLHSKSKGTIFSFWFFQSFCQFCSHKNSYKISYNNLLNEKFLRYEFWRSFRIHGRQFRELSLHFVQFGSKNCIVS